MLIRIDHHVAHVSDHKGHGPLIAVANAELQLVGVALQRRDYVLPLGAVPAQELERAAGGNGADLGGAIVRLPHAEVMRGLVDDLIKMRESEHFRAEELARPCVHMSGYRLETGEEVGGKKHHKEMVSSRMRSKEVVPEIDE